MNPLTRRASRSELRELAIDLIVVLVGGLAIAAILAGGV